jgi:hypothetical protein
MMTTEVRAEPIHEDNDTNKPESKETNQEA